MTMLSRRDPRTLFPELFDWLEAPFTGLRFATTQPIRLEDFMREGRYVLRAELPGVDPDRDVEVTVDDGVLTIHAERRQETTEGHRSEFRYGSFTRSVTLPPGSDPADIKATYDKGILEVSVKCAPEQETGKRIAIEKKS